MLVTSTESKQNIQIHNLIHVSSLVDTGVRFALWYRSAKRYGS